MSESTAHLSALPCGLGIGQTFHYIARPHIETGALVPLLARLRAFVDWSVEVFGAFSAPP